MMYTRYFNKLEILWTKYQHDQIKDKKATSDYFELRQSDWENIEELDCKLNIKRYKRLMNKTEVETNHYINKYHTNG